MELKEVKMIVEGNGYSIASEERLPNGTGTGLKLVNGAIINVFDKGTLSFQGKKDDKLKSLFDLPLKPQTQTNEVFVVYGHDELAKTHLEAMLRRWGLEPLILDQLPSEGQTLIEKLEKYTGRVNFAVVLATPDDEGSKANRPEEKAFRVRQNVVLELGMMLKQLGRKNVAILLKEQKNMDKPSDIEGLIYIPFKDALQKEAGQLLAKEMVAQGYRIDVKKL